MSVFILKVKAGENIPERAFGIVQSRRLANGLAQSTGSFNLCEILEIPEELQHWFAVGKPFQWPLIFPVTINNAIANGAKETLQQAGYTVQEMVQNGECQTHILP